MDLKKTFRVKAENLLLPENKVEEAMALFPGQGKGEVRKKLSTNLGKRLLYTGILAILVLIALAVKGSLSKKNSLIIVRSALNQGSQSIKLTLDAGDSEAEYDLVVGSSELTDEEIDALHAEVSEALDTYILNGNADIYSISGDLAFPAEIDIAGYNLTLTWSSDRIDIVDKEGHVSNSDLDMSATVTIRAKVIYGSEYRTYERLLTVLPKAYTQDEQAIREAVTEIEEMESNRLEDTFTLPDRVGTVSIALKEDSVNYTAAGALLAVIILLVGYYSFFETLSEKKKKRVEAGVADYKDFVRKLTLLLAAGLSVRLAWKKLCEDYGKNAGKSLLSEVMQVSLREMDSGIREQVCFTRFGERMGSRPYERLAEILSQQSEKGVKHLSQVLEAELRDVCDTEKEQIKVRAEKAGTALLFPIVGLLAIVFLVIMVPAFAGMSV